jgi:hypothetical protein
MAADDIWALTGKKLSGEASPQELRALKNLVDGNESNTRALLYLEQMWLVSGTQTPPKLDDINKKWDNFKRKLKPASLKK